MSVCMCTYTHTSNKKGRRLIWEGDNGDNQIQITHSSKNVDSRTSLSTSLVFNSKDMSRLSTEDVVLES